MDDNTQKEQIAGLYSRVASMYGHVGPNFFAYAGKELVEHMGIRAGATVLDVAAGRGANLFPAANVVGPRGKVVGIDLAEGMVRETKAEIERQQLQQATIEEDISETLCFQYIVAIKGS